MLLETKAPVTPNGDDTSFVQRSENRCGVVAKYILKYQICQ